MEEMVYLCGTVAQLTKEGFIFPEPLPAAPPPGQIETQ